MQFVLVVFGQLIAGVLRVVAGKFAAGLAEAGGRRTEVGTGAAEVVVHLVGQLVEHFFELGGGGAEEHDITGGAVHVGQAGTTEIPDVAELTEESGAVVLAGRLGHTHGVEVSHAGEHFRLVAVTADNAAAVTENADDAAVFPVGFLVVVAELKKAKKIFAAVLRDLIVKVVLVGLTALSLLFDVGHNTRPGAGFELVQHGGLKFHYHTSTWFG